MAVKYTRHLFGVILLILTASTILVVTEPADAQTIPKPAVPQFSIQYVDYSYDTPAYNTTDQYTGKQIYHPSQHIGDVWIEGKIRNQPFTSYTLFNENGTGGTTIRFYYNVRTKGSFGTEWINMYGYHNNECITQNSSSEFTDFTIYLQDFPEGYHEDYQVEALIGFENTTWIGPYPQPVIVGEESGWSNTLTLVFTKNQTEAIAYASNIDNTPYPALPTPPPSPTPSAAPTPSPTVPEFPVAIFLVAVLAAVSLLVIFTKKHSSKHTY